MRKTTNVLSCVCLAALVASAAHAAPADWKSYLCRYGNDGADRAQVFRVNEKDSRVTANDRELAPKFTATGFSFEGPPEVFWSIPKAGGNITVLGRQGPMKGSCRIVDD